jgi:alpha-glucoside transport system substrate-binding protein
MRRRDALKALALPALAGLQGCGGGRRRIRVAVVWSGWELTQFRKVLRDFPERGAWDVGVQSMGDDVEAMLGNRVADTVVPDVALVSRRGLVEGNLDRLVPLRPASPTDSAWDRLLTFTRPAHGDRWVYGSWFKVTHKSLVWFRRDRPDVAPPPQWNWDVWLTWCRTLADRALAGKGTPPLALGAADGYVLTDWFENVLLGYAPQVYRGLIPDTESVVPRASWRDPAVAEALRRLGELWSIRGLFAGGPERALLTQFDQSVLDVFERGAAAMVVGADFAWPVITQYSSIRRDRIAWRPFPRATAQPVLVGGDAAVQLREGDGARRLIEWLGSPRAARTWAREGGFLSINDEGTAGYPKELDAGRLIEQVRRGSGDGGTVTFDLSDQLRGRLAGGEGRGSWKIFKDFFTAVAVERSPVPTAVRRTVDTLDAAARLRSVT